MHYVAFEMLCCLSIQLRFVAVKIEGTGYEVRQTLKKQTRMARLMLEGSRPCTTFLTNTFLLVTQPKLTFLLVSSSARSKRLLCFVQSQGQKREQKHTTKNFVEFHNHSYCAVKKQIALVKKIVHENA